MIRALDNTWHRPFTTLELAALQGLVDPEEHLELDDLKDSFALFMGVIMFYGFYNKKPVLPIIAPYFLTRNDILGDGNITPWLTTRKNEAIEIRESLLLKFPDITVEMAMVSTLIPWEMAQYER